MAHRKGADRWYGALSPEGLQAPERGKHRTRIRAGQIRCDSFPWQLPNRGGMNPMAGHAGRDRSRRDARRPAFRDPRPVILIVSEGKSTEPEYFEQFAA